MLQDRCCRAAAGSRDGRGTRSAPTSSLCLIERRHGEEVEAVQALDDGELRLPDAAICRGAKLHSRSQAKPSSIAPSSSAIRRL
jgi:hypothetical protein